MIMEIKLLAPKVSLWCNHKSLMTFFYEHLLNHTHWVLIRLIEDAPKDVIHNRLTWIFDNGVRDSFNCYMKSKGDEI